jgi:hypothetical protein
MSEHEYEIAYIREHRWLNMKIACMSAHMEYEIACMSEHMKFMLE